MDYKTTEATVQEDSENLFNYYCTADFENAGYYFFCGQTT
jgi:hypothetical protein